MAHKKQLIKGEIDAVLKSSLFLEFEVKRRTSVFFLVFFLLVFWLFFFTRECPPVGEKKNLPSTALFFMCSLIHCHYLFIYFAVSLFLLFALTGQKLGAPIPVQSNRIPVARNAGDVDNVDDFVFLIRYIDHC
jgi:hypothetical protein